MKKSLVIILILLMGIVIATAVGIGTYLYLNVLNSDLIYEGVKIDNYNVSNKTIGEALRYIEDKKRAEIKEKYMNLLEGEDLYTLNLEDLGFSYKYDDAVMEAYRLGREGNLISRLLEIRGIENGMKISLESFYDKSKLENIVRNISDTINKEPKDANFSLNNGNIVITEEILGKSVVENKLMEDIEGNIHELKDLIIPVDYVEPRLRKEFLSRINGVIGEYSTSFKGSSKGRIENIKLSSDAISHKLILPGEEFSYNDTTGPRSRESGYKEANVILAGELTPGLGGGVCQTSTTMYNAILLADLTILERHPHSIPAEYVPYGQDAAVSYGYLDLKFRNDFDFPIYTYGKIQGDRLYIYIYGDKKSKNYEVKIMPEIVETIKPQTEVLYEKGLDSSSKIEVQRGRTGYKVKTYKSIIKNGKTTSKEQITSDHYRKRDYIYKTGLD